MRGEQAQVGTLMPSFIEQSFNQGSRVTMGAVHRLGEKRADAADPHGPLIEDAGDAVPLRAGEQLCTIEEREP